MRKIATAILLSLSTVSNAETSVNCFLSFVNINPPGFINRTPVSLTIPLNEGDTNSIDLSEANISASASATRFNGNVILSAVVGRKFPERPVASGSTTFPSSYPIENCPEIMPPFACGVTAIIGFKVPVYIDNQWFDQAIVSCNKGEFQNTELPEVLKLNR